MEGNILLVGILILVIAAHVIQLFLYLYYYFRTGKTVPVDKISSNEPVTVIIAARNEAKNLKKNLPYIFAQDHPEFQVVVVNDSSWDDTAAVLEEFKAKYPNLHVATVHENPHFDGGKKFALTLGIKAAKYDRLLLTDADCRPNPYWIKTILKSVVEQDSLILGYSPVKKTGGVANAFIRFDNFFTALQYIGSAMAGKPYMGVGRNLSYSRDFFLGTGGFKRHYLLASGDDDLFVNEHAESLPVYVNTLAASFVETDGQPTFAAFWRQKRRHFSTGKRYRKQDKLRLLLYPASLLIIVFGTVGLMLLQSWVYLLIALLGMRLIVQIYIFRRSMLILGHKDLIWIAPVLDLFYLFFGILLHSSNILTKQPKWKT